MPKIPTKTKKQSSPQRHDRLETKVMADRLLYVETLLTTARKELSMLWEALYTKGLTERGPITETKDAIPF
jgi:hypothetical protein